MKITILKIGDSVQETDTGKIYTVSTLRGDNPNYPINFREATYANWSLSYIKDNFTFISNLTWYEIY